MSLKQPPLNIQPLTQNGFFSPAWSGWLNLLWAAAMPSTQSGTTANRPVKGLYTGRFYFDTTLGKPIWYKTSGWVDATGASV